jgi:hypothetical protein
VRPPALTTHTSRSPSPPPSPYPQLTLRVKAAIASISSGDARTALSLLELVLLSPPTTPESALLDSLRRSVSTSYDRTGDSHYDLISALHKSVRGSQPDAALYWLARMLEAGENPVYVARRMAVCASEDIGMADRRALPMVSTSHLTYMRALTWCVQCRLWRRCRLVRWSACLGVVHNLRKQSRISLRRRNRRARMKGITKLKDWLSGT